MNVKISRRSNRSRKYWMSNQSGFTILETLIALFLSGLISFFAMRFYVSEHNNLLVQQNVSDMQHSLRAALREVGHNVMNAGANLPPEFLPLEVSNTNPDSLTIRFAPMGGSVTVGDHTQIKQASPIHIAVGSDVSQFSAGMRVRLWHANLGVGEWVTITKVATNNGVGWIEIHHQGQVLQFAPEPGDLIIALQERSYFVDAADTTNPLFMVLENGGTPDIYSENVDNFDVRFILKSGDTVSTLVVGDTALSGIISMGVRTADVDHEAVDRNIDGRRRRSQTLEIAVRNNMQ